MTVKRVLVIDDEPAIQAIVQVCLEDIAGWQVYTAESGKKGIETAIAKQPDAILLDVMMADMSGIQTLEKLRENPETKEIPVVFLTATLQPEDQEKFAHLGIAGVIVKPFSPIDLIEQIALLLNWQI